MIVVATSGANGCQYCVVAHGAILRIRAKNPRVADQVAINYRKAEISPRQTAMLDFAMKVATASHAVGEADSVSGGNSWVRCVVVDFSASSGGEEGGATTAAAAPAAPAGPVGPSGLTLAEAFHLRKAVI
jgi:AhpD family alkylhydroperoxidase